MSKHSSFKLLYSDLYLNLHLFAPLHLWDRGEAARSRKAYANVLRTILFLIFISAPFLNTLSPGMLLSCMIDGCIHLGVRSILLASTFWCGECRLLEMAGLHVCREHWHVFKLQSGCYFNANVPTHFHPGSTKEVSPQLLFLERSATILTVPTNSYLHKASRLVHLLYTRRSVSISIRKHIKFQWTYEIYDTTN
jgi:hypothetical protein